MDSYKPAGIDTVRKGVKKAKAEIYNAHRWGHDEIKRDARGYIGAEGIKHNQEALYR